jgi:hypothetical protein
MSGLDVVTHCTVILFIIIKSVMLNDLNQESEMENLQFIFCGPQIVLVWLKNVT